MTDTNTYALTTVIDVNNHQSESFSDGFGKARYDWLGNVTSVYGPNPPPGAAGRSTAIQATATSDL